MEGDLPVGAHPRLTGIAMHVSSALSLLKFPAGPGHRVFDIALLVARYLVLAALIERAHQLQTSLLHNAPGRRVHRHRLREHPADAELRETLADQSPRPFGPVAFAPRRLTQPISELRL